METESQGGASQAAPIERQEWFGHPRGLSTLFFTEMWERFSYYGMRALLVLFMTAPLVGANPGFEFGDGRATAIYGLYVFFVYVLALPGGWVADNLWGQKKAIFVGGFIIMLGHFTLGAPLVGLPGGPTFFLGLALVSIGTGFLKPNVSSVVGDLYPEGGARRDAGFSIFYMGINVGAILGPTICSLLGEQVNWHWGFSAAGFGMLLGLIQYKLGERHLKNAGDLETDRTMEQLRSLSTKFYAMAAVFVGAALLIGILMSTGAIGLTLQQLAGSLGFLTLAIALVYFVYVYGFGGHDNRDRKHILVIVWLFVLSVLFWSGFEQAGSSLNLFAERLTDRTIFGWEMPAGWFQNINPTFIVIFAPVFGALWVWLARRNANPSIPVKFALGLLGVAAGFLVLSWGAVNATDVNKAAPTWLITTYLLHTWGELCLSPVGLSSVTKLAPKGRVSQMMGLWFVSIALGNLVAGLVAGRLETLAPASLFSTVAIILGVGGLVALIAAPFVQKLVHGIK